MMPSVSASGTRADIVYVDTRLASKFDIMQTSVDGALRGRDTSLTDGSGYAPDDGASLGQRIDAAAFGAPDDDHAVVVAYFPDANGGLGTVSEAELSHGTTPPMLPLKTGANASRTIGKNTTFSAATWLDATDPDGDPIAVTVDNPPHGTVSPAGLYTPDPSWAGTDSVSVHVVDSAGNADNASHPITITNAEPTFDAPAPAIVDEGGAVVTVPLHADDPDFNDVVVYSVQSAEAPLNVAGRATIVGSSLRLDIPAGVRSMAPLRITLRARDTTTGQAPAYADQDLSVTIRPDLATPTTSLPSVDVTGVRASLSAPIVWNDFSNGCLQTKPRTCHTRQVWDFGDGSPSRYHHRRDVARARVSPGGLVHRPGHHVGPSGASQVAAPPKSFNVSIQDDGRVPPGDDAVDPAEDPRRRGRSRRGDRPRGGDGLGHRHLRRQEGPAPGHLPVQAQGGPDGLTSVQARQPPCAEVAPRHHQDLRLGRARRRHAAAVDRLPRDYPAVDVGGPGSAP